MAKLVATLRSLTAPSSPPKVVEVEQVLPATEGFLVLVLDASHHLVVDETRVSFSGSPSDIFGTDWDFEPSEAEKQSRAWDAFIAGKQAEAQTSASAFKGLFQDEVCFLLEEQSSDPVEFHRQWQHIEYHLTGEALCSGGLPDWTLDVACQKMVMKAERECQDCQQYADGGEAPCSIHDPEGVSLVLNGIEEDDKVIRQGQYLVNPELLIDIPDPLDAWDVGFQKGERKAHATAEELSDPIFEDGYNNGLASAREAEAKQRAQAVSQSEGYWQARDAE